MKRILFVVCLTAAFAAGPAYGLDVDTFETYADEAELDAVWKGTAGNGAEDPQLVLTGGANSTSQFMKMFDTGFTMGISAVDILTTQPAGTYKLSFYYKNGLDGELPIEGLNLVLNQGETDHVNVTLSPTVAPPVSPDWIFYESNPFIVSSGTSITVSFGAYSDEQQENSYSCGIDEIIMTPIANAPPVVEISPDERIYLSRTRTITADLSFGSGTFTKVEFDVGDNGSIEFTDTVAPFEFEWDTLPAMPQDTAGNVALKVTATDSNMETGSTTGNYYVDNRYGGREVLVNSDFSQFQNGSEFGFNLPVGWFEYQVSGNATYGPGPGRSPEAGTALQVTFAGSDYGDRYTVRSEILQGEYTDLQNVWWGKGGNCRMYYWTSTDGVTFENPLQDAGVANNANWTYVVETPVQQLGLAATSSFFIATHQFLGGDSFYDDVSLEGMEVPSSNVETWNLY